MTDPTTPMQRGVSIEADEDGSEITFFDGAAKGQALQERWLTVNRRVVLSLEECQ